MRQLFLSLRAFRLSLSVTEERLEMTSLFGIRSLTEIGPWVQQWNRWHLYSNHRAIGNLSVCFSELVNKSRYWVVVAFPLSNGDLGVDTNTLGIHFQIFCILRNADALKLVSMFNKIVSENPVHTDTQKWTKAFHYGSTNMLLRRRLRLRSTLTSIFNTYIFPFLRLSERAIPHDIGGHHTFSEAQNSNSRLSLTYLSFK